MGCIELYISKSVMQLQIIAKIILTDALNFLQLQTTCTVFEYKVTWTRILTLKVIVGLN